jgi:membrane protease subunit (stomatin/prohibitin family)
MADALNEELSGKWRDTRGIEIVAFGISSLKASEEDEKMLKEMQKTAAYADPSLAGATLVNAQAQAMQSAASKA